MTPHDADAIAVVDAALIAERIAERERDRAKWEAALAGHKL